MSTQRLHFPQGIPASAGSKPHFARLCSAGVSPASSPGVPPGGRAIHAAENWHRFSLRAVLSVALLLSLWLPARVSGESIVNSKHNLSLSGPGDIKSATEADVCIFCHTPHNATK